MFKAERSDIYLKYRDVLMEDPCFKAGYDSYHIKSWDDNPYQPFEPFVAFSNNFNAKVGNGTSISDALANGTVTKEEYNHLQCLDRLNEKTPYGRWRDGRVTHWIISGDPIGG